MKEINKLRLKIIIQLLLGTGLILVSSKWMWEYLFTNVYNNVFQIEFWYGIGSASLFALSMVCLQFRAYANFLRLFKMEE